jgi:CheY-like chemotaxis protein
MVVLDIMMPDVNGWEVCRRIKTINPHIMVLICSVLRDPKHIEKSIKSAGADEHITKPLSFTKVLDTVSCLESRPYN